MENFAKKLAINHKVQDKSNKKTFPLKDVEHNFEVIKEAYGLLLESVKKNVPIPPSGEWLLDNFYIVEEQVGVIKNSLNVNKYKNLPGIDGAARVYILAKEFINYTDGKTDKILIENFINAYESKRALLQCEIYELPLMLQIALIEHIKNISDKIITSQLQKFKVESLVERIINNKPFDKQKFNKYRSINLNNEAESYVEYMIYLLKKMGKKGTPYLDALEEEIMKVGTSSAEIIKSEHYDMAIRRIGMSNGILSLKNISRLNWNNIFENINYLEKILLNARDYENLDETTKELYKNTIKSIADNARVSEIYIANEALEFANNQNICLAECLIGDEKDNFLDSINYKKTISEKLNDFARKNKLILYLISIYIPTTIVSILISPMFLVLLFIPISEAVVSIVNMVITRNVKPKIIPKFEKISEDVNTMVVVPTLLNSKERVLEMMQNLEIYYLSNKIDNLYFCLLGDASEEKEEVVSHDKIVELTGVTEARRLNEKYETNVFNFIYRNRVYNDKQESYLGYERKRGMLTEFNNFLMTGEQGTFRVNTIKNIPKIKYVVTLDADTRLVIGSAQKLIGAMEHPLNKPIIKKGIVVKGYGLMQPKVGISIESSTKSTFAKMFAGSGGIDIYSTAESNVYQDIFGEAIFTGKGIYNVEVFDEVLKNEIPENTVLSHDLLEGSYVRVGLVSDIELIDGFPARVNSYMTRLARWTRGDWQIISWLKNPKINALSKYKILDNLRRSLVDIFTLSLFFAGFFWTPLALIFFPFLIDYRSNIKGIKNFIQNQAKRENNKHYFLFIDGTKGNFYRCLINLILLPYKSYIYLNSIVTTLYRLAVSKKHLLDWVTAADAEKKLKNDIKSYAREMISGSVIGFFLILSTLIYNKLSLMKVTFLFILWYLAPFISFEISKTLQDKKQKINEDDKTELLDISRKTWNYFNDFMTKENNYLPPDNYEENRKVKLAKYTSSTNIGLGLLAIISAYNLKFITKEEMLEKLSNTLNTISKLEKWNGHLYNWYNIKTLEPLKPEFISSVDSGNFIGYMYVVKSVLSTTDLFSFTKKEELQKLLDFVQVTIEETDFTKLYDYDKNLFSIGFDVKENKLVDSYYDLLASEARTASFVAIAKRDISYKHWFYLGRTLTNVNGYKGLVSWSGTMFEYFMPNIIMPSFDYSLLEETYRFCIYSQKEYAKKLNIPWGISESAFNLQDMNYNYQYKAFGIPWLGLKRGLSDEVVVSPYSSVLTITKDLDDVMDNIKELKKYNAYNNYGFYESIDFTPSRVGKEKYEIVKTYMAHHQALILLSINNLLNDNVLQNLFLENPEIQMATFLLEEKIPKTTVYTNIKKEKVEVLKYKDYEDTLEKIIHNPCGNVSVLTNDNMFLLVNDIGEGYSKYDDIYINKYNEKAKATNIIYIKDKSNNECWSNNFCYDSKEPSESSTYFTSSQIRFYRKDNNIETYTKLALSAEDNVELKQIEIRNNRMREASIEVISYLEPILAPVNSDIVHPAYNNLFLCAEEFNDNVVIKKKFHNGKMVYFSNFVTSNNNLKFEYELDKSKLIGRCRDYSNPLMVEENMMFSNVIAPIANTVIATKTGIVIPPGESVVINYYMAVTEDESELKELIEKYSKPNSDKRLIEMATSRSLVENRFYNLKAKNIELYNALLSELYKDSKTKLAYENEIKQNKKSQKDLWKYGISGDNPIILAKVKSIKDVFMIKDLISAIEYFCIKKLQIDLVIINEETDKESYVYNKIVEYVSRKNILYLLNCNGGIHILRENSLEKGDLNLLYVCSNVIFDAKNGFLKQQLGGHEISGN